jgi:hypothetical protein
MTQTTSPTKASANGHRATLPNLGLEARGRTENPSPKRLGQWAATVLFIVVVVLAAGWLWTQKGHQTDVLAVTRGVPAGSVLTQADLESVSVSGVNGAIPVSDMSAAVGKTLVVGLTPGQILTQGVITSSPVPGNGFRVVAALLTPGRVPVGLSAGAAVDVLAAPPSSSSSAASAELSNPQVLAPGIQVLSVDSPSSSQTAGGTGTQVSLLVPASSANEVAEYAAAGEIVLVQAPVGGGQ